MKEPDFLLFVCFLLLQDGLRHYLGIIPPLDFMCNYYFIKLPLDWGLPQVRTLPSEYIQVPDDSLNEWWTGFLAKCGSIIYWMFSKGWLKFSKPSQKIIPRIHLSLSASFLKTCSSELLHKKLLFTHTHTRADIDKIHVYFIFFLVFLINP